MGHRPWYLNLLETRAPAMDYRLWSMD